MKAAASCATCHGKLPERVPADTWIPYCDDCLFAATLRYMPGVLMSIQGRKSVAPDDERVDAVTGGGRRAQALVDAIEGRISWDEAERIAGEQRQPPAKL